MAAQQIVQIIEHAVVVVRILRIVAAGKQTDGKTEFGDVVRAEVLIKISPPDDGRDGSEAGNVGTHNLKRMAATVGCSGNAKLAQARNRDRDRGRIADRAILHSNHDCLKIIDFVWSS